MHECPAPSHFLAWMHQHYCIAFDLDGFLRWLEDITLRVVPSGVEMKQDSIAIFVVVKGKGKKNERNENLEQTLNGCVS